MPITTVNGVRQDEYGATYDEYGQLMSGPTSGPNAPAPQQPPPSPEQVQAAALNFQKYAKDGRGGWMLVPMSNEERTSLQLQQTQGSVGQPGASVNAPLANQGASAQPAQPTFTAPQRANIAPGVNTGTRVGGFGTGNTSQRTTIADTGSLPGAAVLGQRHAQNVTPGSGSYTPVTVDYSRYDRAAQGYQRAVDTFQSELDRLSGVDPFGNQAFLRKATDRGVAQAAGVAAGGLSTATARAGNMRQAQGVQAQMAAQGRDEMALQRSRDEQTAGGLRLQAAGGMAQTLGAQAQNEVELAKLQTQTLQANLDGYLKKYGIDATLRQQDVESLRRAAIELQGMGEQAREADMDAILKKYGIDEQTRVALKQISAQEHISAGEFLMGTIGAVAGVAGSIATAPKGSMVNPAGSDRRFKFDVHDPDLRDLEDYLGRTKGKLYRYKEPNKPGRRAGLNFGPMAQDLAKSKIGKTVVVKGEDGLYVDTARLALADHAALAALAAEVRTLKGAKS